MRCIEAAERRARLVVRHHLAPAARASSPLEVAQGLVALHATDAASVFLAIWARMHEPRVGDIERALYDDKHLVRMLGMRRTMFVVPTELMPVVHAACTEAIAAAERRRTLQFLAEAEFAPDPEAWLGAAEEATMGALRKRGEATANELTRDVPALRERMRVAVGKPYEGWLAMSTRVLFLLSAEGRVVRGRPRGSWISSQHRWAPIERWFADRLPSVQTASAQAALVRAWLARFGPGTQADLRWWTGLSAREIQRAVDAIGAVAVDLGQAQGYVLADDLEPIAAPAPAAALLPALDPGPMGWREREWFLGPHAARLFDRSGNIGPSVWWDGRIVGGWAQRPNAEVVVRLLEDVGAEARTAVDAAADDLSRWLDGVRVTPRFRTPLEKELSAG